MHCKNGRIPYLDIKTSWALGEAEAELAHLNRQGVIDAIMTDDVDTLVFGALAIIKKYAIFPLN